MHGPLQDSSPELGGTDDAGEADQHPPTVGSFRFWFAGERWEWSDELTRMHGYEPGTVQPTTELLLSHKHPDDRAQVQDLLDHVLHSGESFSSRHRFLDTAGAMHNVVVVADRMFDEDGTVVGTSGYYIDLTDTIAESTQEVLDATLRELVEARALIEQAKGALMVVYRINANQAFQVLRWRSQETNTKLRALAAQLVAELATISLDSTAAQNRFDHLLLTVHERIPPEPPAHDAATAHAHDRSHRVHTNRPAAT
ncbi:PAS and ANTAR domain-containing protein [Nocardia tengchongensis]|uniref:PAS and ANTAR domain-containing protein n=1 Tax=Nocardia tengchongensis TaxID=2055889 RepID=UPI0036C16559